MEDHELVSIARVAKEEGAVIGPDLEHDPPGALVEDALADAKAFGPHDTVSEGRGRSSAALLGLENCCIAAV